jgi:penicillin-binding protein 1A
VLTTLDQDIQYAAEEILTNAINKNKETRNVTQGAVVVLDYFGGIKAMVGGVDYNKSQFNRAAQALRQPGSSFKPFVYLAAFEQGWKVMDKVDDYPIEIGKWKPENYDKKHYGEVTLMMALTKSLNLATINLTETIGRDRVIRLAKKMGIRSKINNSPSLALGSFEVTMLDMVSAYATMAHRGYEVRPYSIHEIYTKDGYQLYMKDSFNKHRIVDKEATRKLTEIMENVIKNGTGKRANSPKLKYKAGKTGTSQDYRDAWFIGWTDKYICAVWVGNDDNSPTKGVGGGGLPAEIWRDIMVKAQERK